MKKLFLTLTAVTALTLASNAQTEQGKFLVGGQVGFESSKTEVKDVDFDTKSTKFSITPTVGYFVSDNWAVGTAIGYDWGKYEPTDNRTDKTSEFKVAPFVRNYVGNGQFRFFSQLSAPMSWGTRTVEENKADKKEFKTESYGVEIAPGFAFFPTSNIGIELKVRGLYFESNKDKTADITNTKFGLDADSFAPTLGVQFHF